MRKTNTQFHAASMDMTEEAMEQLRYGLSRSGPLQEALDHALKELDGCVLFCFPCWRRFDGWMACMRRCMSTVPLLSPEPHTHDTPTSPSLASLMPKLLALLRSGVGLNTRCCAANVVVVLGTRFRPEVGTHSILCHVHPSHPLSQPPRPHPHPHQVRPHAPQLLRVLAAGSLAERSATARRFFLGALSTVAKLAAEYDVRRLVLRLAREYRAAADVAVHRHRRLPVASAIRWLGRDQGGCWRVVDR